MQNASLCFVHKFVSDIVIRRPASATIESLSNPFFQPPFLPDKDINAASQNDIGSFDEPGKVDQFRFRWPSTHDAHSNTFFRVPVQGVTLSKEDTDVYRDWGIVSSKVRPYLLW